jgi:predicted DsbA family dithiol-disulfide isomerase
VKVEIWSDVVCPWCYIGKRRFEAALERFEHRDEVEVLYRSFELDPEAPPVREGEPAAHLAAKYGVSVEQARTMQQRVVDNAAGEGLAFRYDIARGGNTFDAHRLLHLAAEQGVQAQLKERLMAAYFTQGEPVGDREALARLAGEAGLDAAEAAQVLAEGTYADAVRDDEAQAAALGITGVPFFVLDRRYGVSGAQPADVLLNALRQAWSDAHPLTVLTPAAGGSPDADACTDESCAI